MRYQITSYVKIDEHHLTPASKKYVEIKEILKLDKYYKMYVLKLHWELNKLRKDKMDQSIAAHCASFTVPWACGLAVQTRCKRMETFYSHFCGSLGTVLYTEKKCKSKLPRGKKKKSLQIKTSNVFIH